MVKVFRFEAIKLKLAFWLLPSKLECRLPPIYGQICDSRFVVRNFTIGPVVDANVFTVPRCCSVFSCVCVCVLLDSTWCPIHRKAHIKLWPIRVHTHWHWLLNIRSNFGQSYFRARERERTKKTGQHWKSNLKLCSNWGFSTRLHIYVIFNWTCALCHMLRSID